MNSLVGVERLMGTRDAEPKEEDRVKSIDPDPEKWPSNGAISFQDVVFKYQEKMPQILKGLSFDVKAGEKIGICGR